jgi:hypothetical protein
MLGQEREQWMGGGASDDFEVAKVLKAAEGVERIAPGDVPRIAQGQETIEVELGERLVMRIPTGAMGFLLGELDQAFEMTLVSVLEQGDRPAWSTGWASRSRVSRRATHRAASRR